MENILVSYEVVGEYTGSVLDKGEGVLINTLLGSDNKPVYIVLTKDGRFRTLASNQLKALNVDDKFDRCACENFDKEIDESYGCGEQKSSWSEEDCAYTTLIGEILDYEDRRGKFPTTGIKSFNNDIITVEQIQDWLKSLKEKMKVE